MRAAGGKVGAEQILKRGRQLLLSVSLGLCLANQGCDRKLPNEQKQAEESVISSREVLATWYDVPDTSLAKRRAGSEEMTAAHNHLPIGTRVRVTHLNHHKTVVVRITDRGITKPKIKLDLCKEAAEELGMVGEGIARVRMEVLQDDHARPSEATATPAEASSDK